MIIQKPNPELFKDAIEDMERLHKEAEEALNANKKNAEEIAKYHGEDTKNWKKDGGAAIKLSEALFEDLDTEELINFNDEIYDTLTHVCNHYIQLGLTQEEIAQAVKKFLDEYDYDELDSDYEIPGFEGTYDKLADLTIFKEDLNEDLSPTGKKLVQELKKDLGPDLQKKVVALMKDLQQSIQGNNQQSQPKQPKQEDKGTEEGLKESWSVYYTGDNPEDGTLFDDEDSANKFRDEMGDDWEVVQLDESKINEDYDPDFERKERNKIYNRLKKKVNVLDVTVDSEDAEVWVDIDVDDSELCKKLMTNMGYSFILEEVIHPTSNTKAIEQKYTIDTLLTSHQIAESSEIKRYSDVIPKEQRKFWYFTTHGVQPGSIPKGVNVLETREGKNDKGTDGTFVCLDAILNTSELKEYDLKEMVPSDLNESFEDDMRNEVIKIQDYLNHSMTNMFDVNYNLPRERTWGMSTPTITVTVSGDWKQGHRRCDLLMQDLGYELIDEIIIEEDDTDSYTSEHVYRRSE